MDMKKEGVLVNMDTTLAALTVTSVAGTVSGTTVIDAGAVDGTTDAYYVYKVGDAAQTVTFGTALTAADGWAPLPADGTITATNGKTITVALVANISNLPLASGTATVVSAS
jgi:UDP-N-acetylmuramyl tripeptide synthase